MGAQWKDARQTGQALCPHVNPGQHSSWPAAHEQCLSGRLGPSSVGRSLRDEGRRHEAHEKQKRQKSIDDGFLTPQVSRGAQAAPVHGRKKITHTPTDADHEGIDGECSVALLHSRVMVGHQGFKRGKAGLGTELQDTDGRHQQQHV